MKKIFLLALFALGLMTSCQKENYLAEDVNAGPGFEVTASLEELPQTRTYLSPIANGYKTLWSKGDVLSIFHGGKSRHFAYTLTSGHDTNVADFTWDETWGSIEGGIDTSVPSTLYAAVHPFAADNTITMNGDDVVFNTQIPSSQEYAEGSFGSNASPMVAVNHHVPYFSFKNVASVLVMPLKGDATVVAASLESKAHKIAGEAVVTAEADNNYIPTVSVENGVSKISLVCETEIKLDAENPTNFFFVLAPGTYEANDLVVKFYTSEGDYFATEITAENTFKRSMTHVFGVRTFEINGTDAQDLWVKAEADAYMDADRIVPSITDVNVCEWVIALKDQPNTKALLEEAASYIALKNFRAAYDVLGGIPGFKKDVIRFEATGTNMQKVDYTGAGYLKSFVGDINNIKDIESLLAFIEEFENVYVASGIKDLLDEQIGNILNSLDSYISNAWIKAIIKEAAQKLQDLSFTQMLENAVADPDSPASIVLNYLFAQDAFLNMVKSALTTVVEKIEEESGKLIDGSNADLKKAAIELAKTNAIVNARTDALNTIYSKYDAKNASMIAALENGPWGIFKKLLNSKKCVEFFTEYDLLDVYTAFEKLVKCVEDVVTYDKGTVIFTIEKIDDYQQGTDWWLIHYAN